MSQTSDLKALFRTSSLLTKINTALTTAGLSTISTATGILPEVWMLGEASTLPALAVTVDTTRRGTNATGGRHEVVAEVTCHFAVSDSSEPGVLTDAELYVDVLRATVETNVRTSLQHLRWQSSTVEGERFTNDLAQAVRLLLVTFEAVSWQQEGVV